jgi:hypothetical protein
MAAATIPLSLTVTATATVTSMIANTSTALKALSLAEKTGLSLTQVNALSIVERAMSVVSILGCLFMITTFFKCEEIRRKPFNRLLVYASFGNLMSNAATLISTSGVEAGDHNALCKVQATLIQW